MKNFSLKTQILACCTLGLVLFSPADKPANAGKDFSLPALQKDILGRYDGVSHITAGQLASQIKQSPEDVVLFDVREAGEYSVSHIPGAIQVAPNIWHSPFMRKYGSQLKGKTVVFYCSVGVRSSKLARYVQAAVKKAGARSVVNLEYGIFGWHNDRRQLATGQGETDLVHPYDRHWGQLVSRSALTSYKPGK